MRITNRVVTEKYIRSVNSIATELDRLNNQVVTERKFTKVSENTAAAVKAFQIRKDLARVEGYQKSIGHAQSMLNNAESSIMKIQDMLHDAREKIVQGLNGTQSGEEREIISTHLAELQEQVLQVLNANAADTYYFGGNSVRQEPFSVDPDDGSLRYRYKEGDEFKWIKVKDIVTEDDPATPAEEDALYKELMNAGLFVDIGMGIRSDSTNYTPPATPATTAVAVDRNSVFTYTLPGLEITGAGMVETESGEKVSANIYDLLGAIADSFSDSDYSYDKTNELFGFLFGADLDENGAEVHRPGSAQTVQFAITNIGTKMQFLGFMSDSMASRKLDGLTQQQATEGADMAETIIYYDAQKLAYQAALSMGAQVIPMSIFNYMS